MIQGNKGANYIPLEYSDNEFIHKAATNTVNNKFRYDHNSTRCENSYRKNNLLKSIQSDLRSFLTRPHDYDIHELGAVLHYMKNIDRLQFLNKRPSLIKNFDELYRILQKHIEKENRLLIASNKAELLYHTDPDICKGNLNKLLLLLPESDRKKFKDFASCIIAKEAALHTLAKESRPTPPDTLSLSILLAAGAIFSYAFADKSPLENAASIASICTFLHGIYEYLNQDRQTKPEIVTTKSHSTMWQKKKATHPMTTTARPSYLSLHKPNR